jgi:hypothetical protein
MKFYQTHGSFGQFFLHSFFYRFEQSLGDSDRDEMGDSDRDEMGEMKDSDKDEMDGSLMSSLLHMVKFVKITVTDINWWILFRHNLCHI